MDATMNPAGFTEKQRINFYHSAEVIKQRLGFPRQKSRPVRELIRNGTFPAMVEAEIHCATFDYWPLREQLEFVEALAPLSVPEKEVRIYEKVYDLCTRALRQANRDRETYP